MKGKEGRGSIKFKRRNILTGKKMRTMLRLEEREKEKTKEINQKTS